MKVLVALAAFCGLALAADNCPHDKEVECITDVNHGTLTVTQHLMFVIKPLGKGAKTCLQTSPA